MQFDEDYAYDRQRQQRIDEEGKMKAWFEILDGSPQFLGYFDDMDDALEKSGPSASWVFDNEGLEIFIVEAREVLDRARDSS